MARWQAVIRDMRSRRQLTLKGIARHVGVTSRAVSAWFEKPAPLMRRDVIRKLFTMLGYSELEADRVHAGLHGKPWPKMARPDDLL